jgi:hypothetical protein
MLQIIAFLMGGCYDKIVNIWNYYAVMGHGCNGKLVTVWNKFEFSRVVMLWKCNHVRNECALTTCYYPHDKRSVHTKTYIFLCNKSHLETCQC